MITMPSCSHKICQNEPKGVAVCLVDPEKKKILLGRERFGKYRGKYNLCAGSVEPEDEGCAVNAAKRELSEEFKLIVHDFDKFFGLVRRNELSLRLIMIGPTPVFVGYFDTDTLKQEDVSQLMQAAISDDALPGTQKEMEEAKWFPWDEHVSMEWSRFARIALKKFMNRSNKPFQKSTTNVQS